MTFWTLRSFPALCMLLASTGAGACASAASPQQEQRSTPTPKGPEVDRLLTLGGESPNPGDRYATAMSDMIYAFRPLLVERCGRSVAAESRHLPLRVVMRMEIGRDGRVTSAEFQEGTFPTADAEACAVEWARMMRFPLSPQKPGPTTATYLMTSPLSYTSIRR